MVGPPPEGYSGGVFIWRLLGQEEKQNNNGTISLWGSGILVF
jgi:hypothetical protein